MSFDLFKILPTNSVFRNHIYLIQDFALNNPVRFICLKLNQPTNQPI